MQLSVIARVILSPLSLITIIGLTLSICNVLKSGNLFFISSNNLAGLEDTIGDRGMVIPGDAMTDEWTSSAFNKICEYLDNPLIGNELIQKNYEWALTHSWKDRAIDFLQNYIIPVDPSMRLSQPIQTKEIARQQHVRENITYSIIEKNEIQ